MQSLPGGWRFGGRTTNDQPDRARLWRDDLATGPPPVHVPGNPSWIDLASLADRDQAFDHVRAFVHYADPSARRRSGKVELSGTLCFAGRLRSVRPRHLSQRIGTEVGRRGERLRRHDVHGRRPRPRFPLMHASGHFHDVWGTPPVSTRRCSRPLVRANPVPDPGSAWPARPPRPSSTATISELAPWTGDEVAARRPRVSRSCWQEPTRRNGGRTAASPRGDGR